jgi:uncharacterized membrane protein
MTIGPVQLIVLGFNGPEFKGEILAELDRLKANDIVRVIDAMAVYKDPDGEVVILERSDLSPEESAEFGALVGGLIGLGAAGEEGMVAGAEAGAEAMADGVDLFSEENAWDVVEDIPKDSAAAIILLEHRWAIPLRDAVIRTGGFPVAAEMISPLDLVGIGLVAADEAQALAAADGRS